MKKYEKPMVTINENLAEGVYAASGSECYSVSAVSIQAPAEGRGTYVFQIDATHDAPHHATQQILTVYFNQPVTYNWSSGTLVSGNGTSVLEIQFNYHNNGGPEFVGFGNLEVVSEAGLGVPTCTMSCNATCSQHEGLY